jgi:hypothetical protein
MGDLDRQDLQLHVVSLDESAALTEAQASHGRGDDFNRRQLDMDAL